MITVDAIEKIAETDQIPLQWVGMEKVCLPIRWNRAETPVLMLAEFDIFVNLVKPSKGIHMSRLYEILSKETQEKDLSFSGMRALLKQFIQSQAGLSTRSKLSVKLMLPVMVDTLKSKKQYFKSVPLVATFLQNDNGEIQTELRFQLDYSSTCPQSAALAHQLTVQEMQMRHQLSTTELTAWYHLNGFVATPHAQRSELDVELVARNEFELDHFSDLFIRLGAALGTPTQGLVKRIDEQEFSRLNASNLMFCEDAARKAVSFLRSHPLVKSSRGKVNHLESLHSHNAVSYFEF